MALEAKVIKLTDGVFRHFIFNIHTGLNIENKCILDMLFFLIEH